MVIVVGATARRVPEAKARAYVAGYAVGLDMTLRDVQTRAKSKGLPWTVAKGFDTSAPLSEAVTVARVPDPSRLALSLTVNGDVRQKASTADMLFPVDRILSYLSGVFTLEPGDLIFTGSPEGVGQVHPGDVLEAALERVGAVRVSVAAAEEPVHG
jgi:2-keto-4-pentenoate hydratase/2-oxohepta-3-ene-1,7-dioic acid hydratase in catechol pathway